MLEQQQKQDEEYNKQSEMQMADLQDKYQAALQEIKDLEDEHENEHAELLDTVRDQEHEIKLLNGMLKMILNNHEIAKIRMKSQFDDDTNEWKIPYFYMKAKDVQFPTLSRIKNRDLVENEKENRDIEFGQNGIQGGHKARESIFNPNSQPMMNGHKNSRRNSRQDSRVSSRQSREQVSRQSRPYSRSKPQQNDHNTNQPGRRASITNDFDEFDKYPSVPKHIENNFGSGAPIVPDRIPKDVLIKNKIMMKNRKMANGGQDITELLNKKVEKTGRLSSINHNHRVSPFGTAGQPVDLSKIGKFNT